MSGIQGMSVELANPGFRGHHHHHHPPVTIPLLGLGVYLIPPDTTYQAVTFALQHGYRHFDTAHLYGNERAVGKAVRDSGIRREDIFVTTKLWNSDHGYQNALRAFERSMNELGLDYVDLYLIHSPAAPRKRQETWKAMEFILKSGKAKSIGVSNYGIHHLNDLFANCEIRPSVNQVELSPFNTRPELVRFCQKENIVLEAYSPLTRGHRLKDPILLKVANHYNKTAAQILIRWCIQKKFVVLPKSATPKRILENSQVFDFELSESDMAMLDSLNDDYAVSWDPTKGV